MAWLYTNGGQGKKEKKQKIKTEKITKCQSMLAFLPLSLV
jgi:hypothetical protein